MSPTTYGYVSTRTRARSCHYFAHVLQGIDQLAEKASLLVPENVTINLDALSVKSYIHNVQLYTSTDVDTIQLSTIGQSDNENWHLLREDRLTSSNLL